MKSVSAAALLLCLHAARGSQSHAQVGLAADSSSAPAAQPSADRITALELAPPEAQRLRALVATHDYPAAQALLIAQINGADRSPRTARLLAFLAGLYVAVHDDRGAAVALSKADAIEPLQPALRFTLAMSLVRLHMPVNARRELTRLATADPSAPLYPYWLGRLDYDAQQYAAAIEEFGHAIALDPAMARAHDNLGLCLFYLNQNDAAVLEFREAIRLDAASARPSAWPFLNLGTALAFVGNLDAAESSLRESLRLDPTLARAHVELGNLLERKAQLPDAVAEFRRAAELDLAYPEPHVALARLYRKLGDPKASQAEVDRYKQLRQQQQSSQPAR